jgi:TatD DNase family protein
MKFYDAHNHLQDARLERDAVLADLEKLPLARAIVNGTRESDWAAVLELHRRNSRFVPSLGLHPWYVAEHTEDWFDHLKRAVVSENCAVGEIGLDHWMLNYDPKEQEEVFAAQLNLAAELNRPVTIHCLKAWGRLFEMLSSERLPSTGFLLHSYSGSTEMLSRFADLGGYFSICGYFAHERKGRQRDVFRHVPRERLLIETDAPDMLPPSRFIDFDLGAAPEPLNSPANIAAIYRFAAELFDLDPERLSEMIEANFQRLFGSVL